jgi:hypothetical protein
MYDVDYVPVDNVDGQFSSAGAALNHGASLARHGYLVFVHQDVYLHSLRALEKAAGILADNDEFGLLGAIGIRPNAELFGRVRDRVVLLGTSAPNPVDVDSVDEVLFMLSRAQLDQEPLSEASELSWHAYAVEYGLRVRSVGKRVGAVDIPLTHNSLTINLAHLDVAHRAVASRYPKALPTRTTCGQITAQLRHRSGNRLLQRHRWRYGWLKESLEAHVAQRAVGRAPFVLSDVRRDIDDILAAIPGPPLQITNCVGGLPFADDGRLELTRRGHTVLLSSVSSEELVDAVCMRRPDTSMLLTNLGSPELRALSRYLPEHELVIGLHDGIGFWILLGPVARVRLPSWRSRRAIPFRMSNLSHQTVPVCDRG